MIQPEQVETFEPTARAGPYVALVGLAAARLRRRPARTVLVSVAIAATILVACTLLAVRMTAADLALSRSILAAPTTDRMVQLTHFGDRRYQDAQVAQDASKLLQQITEFSQPLFGASTFPLDNAPGTLVAFDHVEDWTVQTGGRPAAPCIEGQTCEAVVVGGLIGERVFPIGTAVPIGKTHVLVVGSVDVLPGLPIDLPDDGRFLLVNGRAAFVADDRTAENPRSDRWAVVLDPDRLHFWQLAALAQRINDLRTAAAIGSTSFTVASPESLIREVSERQGIATGRIVFVGSFILAILFGFAVFVAAVDRRDLEQEYVRLVARGAQRRHLLTLVALEALAPSLIGAFLGMALGTGVTSMLANGQGLPVEATVAAVLLDQLAILAIGALVIATTVAVAVGIHPHAGRLIQPRLIGAVVVPVILVLGWDRATRGGVVSARELILQGTGPTTALLPGLLGVAVILGALVILPRVLRVLARRLRNRSVPVRLAALSLARDPVRPAASMTLLALSVGAAVFATTYATTLRAGVETHAAFLAGMDLRVAAPTVQTPFAAQVLPALRDVAESTGATVTPLTRAFFSSPSGAQIAVLGIEAEAIPRLTGWRSDFSSLDPNALSAAIKLVGNWHLDGHPLSAGTRRLSIEINAALDPDPPVAGVQILAILDTGDRGYRRLDLGTLMAGTHIYSADIADPVELDALGDGQPAGWTVVALIAVMPEFAEPAGAFGGLSQGGTLRVKGLDGLVDEADAIDMAVSGRSRRQIVRQPAETDGLALPAIVSPDLMSELDANGLLMLRLPSNETLAVKPVATANYFPTMRETNLRLVVVDEDPLLMALNTRDPGGAMPSEAMIAVGPEGTGSIIAALRDPKLPRVNMIDRAALALAASSDPFAAGIVWALTIGALAGLGLALVGLALGTAAELGDQRGELAELEERGLGPRAIGRLLVVRTTILCLPAGLVGLLIGLGLTWLSSATFAVNADGTIPLPPLVVAIPAVAIAGMLVCVVVVLVGTVALLSRRHFGARLLRQSAG